MQKILEILQSITGKAFLMSLIFLFSFVSVSNASSVIVPLNIQAAMIQKIVKYNSRLHGKNKIKMLIVYNSKNSSEKDNLISELNSNIIEVKSAFPEHLNDVGRDFDLVYFMPGCENMSYICKEHKNLSVSPMAKYVQKGDVSVAIATENDKMRIFVNLTSLKAEEQNLSNDLLRISKVYK